MLHEDHVVNAARAGKHVIVEKPMTFSLDSAQRMIDACLTNDVYLVCGGSRSASATVQRARELVVGGTFGPLRALTTLAATDWMLRPRRPDEYDPAIGGGVVFRQAPHVVDSFRYLAGGLVRSVRAVTGSWMAERGHAPGFFSAILEFENDVVASCIYGGHGYFMAAELYAPDQAGPKSPGLSERIAARKMIGERSDEFAWKTDRLQGVRNLSLRPAATRSEPFLADLGLLVVHCDYGEIRQSPTGLYLYRPGGTEEIPVPLLSGGPSEINELTAALEQDTPLLHSGPWGLATLEVCIGIMESARTHRDVVMHEQVSASDDGDWLPRI
jgi:phthalate 4,5-cis-dihydrodiol dehydrogenase